MTLSQLLSFIHSEVVNIDNAANDKMTRTRSDGNIVDDVSTSNVINSDSNSDSNSGGDEDNKNDQSKAPLPKLRRERSIGSIPTMDQTSHRHIREIQYHDLRHLEHQFNPH